MTEKRKVGTKFVGVLALISIYGFTEIILQSLLDISIIEYSSSVWLIIMSIGFFLAARPKNLYETAKTSISENVFSRIVTLIIGLLALVSGVSSLPQVNIIHPALETIKAVIGVISVIFIILQAWVFDHD